MRSEKYIENVMVTAAADTESIKKRLQLDSTIHMLHAVIGMSTEAGELLDMLKKHIFYGKDIDLINLEEELGDSNWYQSLAITAARLKEHQTSWEQIWEKNINKLQARFGDKFDEAKAKDRDLGKEREVLEK